MAPVGNLAVQETADNSFVPQTLTNPPCQHCGKGTVNWRKRPQQSCELVQLRLSYQAQTRRILRVLIYNSQLPHREFAAYVLGVDEATLWRYLSGNKIPRSKATHLRNIEYVARDGSSLHIVVRTCAERGHWTMMVNNRERLMSTDVRLHKQLEIQS